jgi:GTP-binding protein
MKQSALDRHPRESGGPGQPLESLPLDSRLRGNDVGQTFGDLYPSRDIEPELLDDGRLLFARECRFVAGAASESALPGDSLPEIAFLGRSNVGKSSLVNALTGRSMLARTSNTPGRTRQINFFALDGRLMLVDLPGYGYAAASKSAVSAWTRLVQYYLRRRASLRRICLLIDARHGIKEPDRPVMALCDAAGLSFQVVLTKIDELAPAGRAAIAETVAAELARHAAAHPEIHLTSAEKRLGIASLRATLAAFALPAVAASGKAR